MSSHRRNRTASCAYGDASNSATSSGEYGPPCSSRLRTEAGDSRPDVRRICRAEVSLRGDVHADGLGDLRPEVLAEEGVRDLLVLRVYTVLRRVRREVVDEVAVVVQQRGRDEAWRGTLALGRVRGLEHVLRHRHRLAEVLPRALFAVDAEDLVDQRATHARAPRACCAARRDPHSSPAGAALRSTRCNRCARGARAGCRR